ncbi:MAG: hypothetical protein ABSA52_17480 [Candidatus Binatia bacterium]
MAQEVDSEKLFAALFAHLALSPAGTANEITHSAVPLKLELLAFHLFPFFGKRRGCDVNALHVARGLTALDGLFDSTQRANLFEKVHRSRTSDPSTRELDDLVWFVRLQTQVVRGSAYPEQIAKEISETLGRFDRWFDTRIGISATRAVAALLVIVATAEARATSWIPDLRECGNSFM